MTPLDPAAASPASHTGSDAAHRRDAAPTPPTIRTSLARLSRALTVRGVDTADLSPAALSAASSAVGAASPAAGTLRPTPPAPGPGPTTLDAEPLARLRTLLGDLESLVAATPVQRDEAALAATQAEIDRVLLDVERVAGRETLRSSPEGPVYFGDDGVSVTVLTSAFENIDITSSNLAYGQRVDVDLQVNQYNERGGVLLDFGTHGPGYPPKLDRTVTFEVAGAAGLVTLTFLSGQTYREITNAVNIVGRELGVKAVEDDARRGVFLLSREYGADSFVSVRFSGVASDGSDPGTVRALKIDDNRVFSVGETLATFAQAQEEAVVDHGVDLDFEIPGFTVAPSGFYGYSAQADDGSLSFEFEPNHVGSWISFIQTLPGVRGERSNVLRIAGGASTGANELPGDSQHAAAPIGASPSGLPPASTTGANITVNHLNPAFAAASVQSGDLAYQERADVYAHVVRRAEAAALYLDFGIRNIDLDTGDSFSIEISGPGGTRAFSFASGSAVSDIAAAINVFASETGARAVTSGYDNKGFILASEGFGADDFVSVRVLQTGGGPNAARTVHAVSFDDDGAPHIGDAIATYAEIAGNGPLTDAGADLRLNFGGQEFDLHNGAGAVSSTDPAVLHAHVTANLQTTAGGFTQGLAGVGYDTFLAFTAIGGAQTGANEGPDGVPIGGGGDPSPPPDDSALPPPPPSVGSILRAVRPFATGGALSLASSADQSQRLAALRDALALLDTIAPLDPPRAFERIDFSA